VLLCCCTVFCLTEPSYVLLFCRVCPLRTTAWIQEGPEDALERDVVERFERFLYVMRLKKVGEVALKVRPPHPRATSKSRRQPFFCSGAKNMRCGALPWCTTGIRLVFCGSLWWHLVGPSATKCPWLVPVCVLCGLSPGAPGDGQGDGRGRHPRSAVRICQRGDREDVGVSARHGPPPGAAQARVGKPARAPWKA